MTKNSVEVREVMLEKDFDRFGLAADEPQTNSLEKIIDKYDQTIYDFKITLEKLIETIDKDQNSKGKDPQEAT